MLIAAITLWSLNMSATRYVLTNGLLPLSYTTVRYGLAALTFCMLTIAVERALRVGRADLALFALAIAALTVNQLGFVYSLERTSASVISLILAATPIFAALIGVALRTETLTRRFWVGAAVSFVGVGLVAIGTGREVSGDVGGVALGVLTAATWAVYSVTITPLMQRYSPYRISAIVLTATWVVLALVGLPQTTSQDWSLGWDVWLLVVYATLGPLVLTNVLWFRSLDRIGPSRATLATNLQPFLAAVFAVILLSETLTPLQVLGGVLIAAGILVARRRGTAAPPGE
jgi:drug/metabolite transporter (DMT)-like permease